MAIFYGSSIEQTTAPELPLSCYHGQLYLKKAEVVRGASYTKGVRLCLTAGSNSRRIDSSKLQFERELLLGHSAQDVATLLGAPSKIFYKSEDKMRIHSPNAHRRVTASRSDYFFNYFTLGMVSE